MKTLLKLVLTAVVLSGCLLGAQTVTQTVNIMTPSTVLYNASTVSVPNIPLENGDYLWVHPQSGSEWIMPSENTGKTCSIRTSAPFTDPNPLDLNPIVYDRAYVCPDGKTAHAAYKGTTRRVCRGGKGGGCNEQLTITSGFVTVQ